MRKILLAVSFTLLFLVTRPSQAQTGCVNSPEAPTAILALAGSLGAGLVVVRNRIHARKSK